MHFGDYTFIFLLALVLFGPKKLPEIGRQLGKLLAEFRRASNEFKFQIQEELRNMEEEERRRKLAEQQAALTTTTLAAPPAEEAAPEVSSIPTTPIVDAPSIKPPSTGATVSAERPYATAGEPSEGEPEVEAAASAEQAASPDGVTAEPVAENPSLAGVESGTPGIHHV